jgi:UDP-glucose 4-epimerase
VAEARPEVVHHLAAQIDVRRSVADPLHDARVNVLGTIAVAKAALAAGCRRLVFASSGGTVYGEPEHSALPVDERHPEGVSNPYGVAKRSAEDYLASFADLDGLEPVSLRLGNVYGPRQDPHGEAGVVAIFCNRLLADEPVTVFGDGRQTRDYVYVEDVVDAFVAAGEHPDAPGARLNIATGVETSVLELYAALREVAGFGDEPTFAPPRPGELGRIALDCAEAERVLGWRATVDLREGLRRTWAWAFQEVNAGSVGG